MQTIYKGEIKMFKSLKTIIEVSGMSCKHCASRVKEALEKEQDIKKVSVDLKKNTVTITSTKELELDKVKEIIENLGYVFVSVK